MIHYTLQLLIRTGRVVVIKPGSKSDCQVYAHSTGPRPTPDEIEAVSGRRASGWRDGRHKLAMGNVEQPARKVVKEEDAEQARLMAHRAARLSAQAATPVQTVAVHETRPRERDTDITAINGRRLPVAEPGPAYVDAFGSRRQ